MKTIEPPPQNPDEPAALELTARRVVRYSPWFIWGIAGFWTAFVVLQIVLTGDWLSALRFGAPGLFIGAVLGIRFRDS